MQDVFLLIDGDECCLGSTETVLHPNSVMAAALQCEMLNALQHVVESMLLDPEHDTISAFSIVLK
jgi:hypothetical protein